MTATRATGASSDRHDKHRDIDDCKEHKGAVWCEYCGKWLNGPQQYNDHKTGKKHKRQLAMAKKQPGSDMASAKHMKPSAPNLRYRQPTSEDGGDYWPQDQDHCCILDKDRWTTYRPQPQMVEGCWSGTHTNFSPFSQWGWT